MYVLAEWKYMSFGRDNNKVMFSLILHHSALLSLHSARIREIQMESISLEYHHTTVWVFIIQRILLLFSQFCIPRFALISQGNSHEKYLTTLFSSAYFIVGPDQLYYRIHSLRIVSDDLMSSSNFQPVPWELFYKNKLLRINLIPWIITSSSRQIKQDCVPRLKVSASSGEKKWTRALLFTGGHTVKTVIYFTQTFMGKH